jgi:hypothetical protein
MMGPLGLLPLAPTVSSNVIRIEVDQHLHLPDMFEVTFLDELGSVTSDGMLSIGTEIWVFGGAEGDMMQKPLIAGEITAIEGVYENMVMNTIIRGYDKSHRMQRVRKTRSWGGTIPFSDDMVATLIAAEYAPAILPGEINPTLVMLDQIDQVNETDYDFLKRRAAELGYDFGVETSDVGCMMYFRQAPGLGPLGTVAAVAAEAMSLAASAAPVDILPQVRFKENLISFRPRLTAAGLSPNVEVRMWDPQNADVVVGKADVDSKSAQLDTSAADLAGKFPASGVPSMPSIPGLSLGPAPSAGYIVVDKPIAGLGLMPASQAVDALAKAIAEAIGGRFAEAEGLADGMPDIAAGKYIPVYGVGSDFCGTWYVTNARHVYDVEDGGYRTRFVVSGRADRSLIGLAQGGSDNENVFGSVVCGIVTDVLDIPPLGGGLNRVKVAFPWLSPAYVSNWARVVNFGSGKEQGSLFTPEVGDEVLVAFEMGDPRRPYVIGGLQNKNTTVDYGGTGGMQVMPLGLGGKVAVRGFVTRAGKLLFEDMPMPEGLGAKMVLGMNTDKQGIKIDQMAGTLDINCEPAPPESASPMGAITIKVNDLGSIDIETGATGSITIKTGAGGKISIGDATSDVEISGKTIKLSSTISAQISGTSIQLG